MPRLFLQVRYNEGTKNEANTTAKNTLRFDHDARCIVMDRTFYKNSSNIRFGFGAEYSADGNNHFVVTTNVSVSEQFYAWICGFGTKAKIVAPEQAAKAFDKHLADIQKLYK